MADSVKGAPIEKARSVKEQIPSLFENIGRVVGVGLVSVDDGYGVKVNLASAPNAGSTPPKEVDGVPISIEVVGTIRKF